MSEHKSNVMSDFIQPIGVLAAICIVMTALLAFTNEKTAPIIAEAEAKSAREALYAVMPEAEDFEELTIDDLPSTIQAAYVSTNGVGYTFKVAANGFGGTGSIVFVIGIDNDGLITAAQVLSHGETAGLGSKVAGDDFLSQFPGVGSSLDGVSTISGATISSSAFISAVQDAFTAYDLAKEV